MMKKIMLSAVAVLSLCGAANAAQAVFQKPDSKMLKEANSVYLFRYRYDLKGGAHTNGGHINGKLLYQAVAAYAGDTSADAPLIKHLRFLIDGKNCISANGGYPAQHERLFTTALILAKNTPRVWEKFSDKEKHKFELLIKAALAGSAFTTNDKLFASGRSKCRTIDGDGNCNRGWNPNFREGMIGGIIAGSCFLGGKEAQNFLDTYDHKKFTAELKDAGLTNTYEVFNWKQTHPNSNAPTPEEINDALHNYRYEKISAAEPMKLYLTLVRNTYSGKVNAGLNNGKGRNGSGCMASGADKLPNKGKPGMLKEFASMDANGPRSSIGYAYDGFRPNLANQFALIASGNFDAKDPEWKKSLELVKVGNDDLFYKLDHGYIDYSKGKGSKKAISINDPGRDFKYTRELWYNVMSKYHQDNK